MIKKPGTVFTVSRMLQDIADNKSLCDLDEICDFSVRANDIYNDWGNVEPPDEAWFDDLILQLILLGKKSSGRPLHCIFINEARGESMFFFLGTVNEVKKKLKTIPDEWV